MCMTSTRYAYPYLATGNIRLLHILSVTPSICMRIEVAPLDDADPAANSPDNTPAYTALSYRWWGKYPFARVIVEPEGRYIDIGESLAVCFAHLDALVGTKVWIDALCINQADDEEKSRQVARMGAVYSRAVRVLLWLGPAADGSDAAMEGMARYGRAALEAGLLGLDKKAIAAWPEVGNDPDPARVRTRDALLALMTRACEAEAHGDRAAERFPRVAFATLTQRDYFNRVWMKQEVTLARNADFVCGYKSCDVEAFHAAVLFYGMLVFWETTEWRAGRHTRIPGPFSVSELMDAEGGPHTLIKKTIANPAVGAFCAGRRAYQRGGVRSTLFELLHTSYVRSGGLGLQAADPRDKIYGLLGMASDADELGFATDYTKTADEAYEHVARYLMVSGNLAVLKWCRSRGWCRSLQPQTWVPNFNARIPYTWSDETGVPLFEATGSRTQPTGPLPSGSRPVSIRLQGVRLDAVTGIGTELAYIDRELYEASDQAAARKMFDEIEEFFGQQPSAYTEAERKDALWRVPICDRESHPTSGYFRRATAEYSEPQFVALRTQPLDGAMIGETYSYQMTMLKHTDGARPIRSERGYVGLGPGETARGDVIVFLYGATAPFVLRPTGEVDEYHLVGEAYIYGVMDGEAMDQGLDEAMFELW
ncbi:hypothetical protein N658DRAFT_471647 [Parathielavia hyrcaniae]|uniref:Heterokaryon incompatibility domain-containing protein n=1 Tax=Parathielavia hyrcaniae TaxID=113614 RepID=A0AAN6Q1W2_9PEZI|nr:hypothetical protein N658DRAFT_471647 [Parathielavia hyrcaniae]